MSLAIIVATDENGLIGNNNALPFRLPADLKYFRTVTMGHAIIMGRRTHQSIGRLLPGRKNIIVTKNKGYSAEGCVVVYSIDEALKACKDESQVFTIGGASLYQAMLPKADKLYLTRVHAKLEGDTYFPSWDDNEWQEISRKDHLADDKNEHDYSFIVYQRISATV